FIEGFDSLRQANSISFAELPELKNLPPFDSLLEIDKLFFRRLPSITDFSAFRNVEYVRGNLSFYEVESITDILGFEALKSVGGINISDCSSLQVVDGLMAVETLNKGIISVFGNNKLKNINGFSGLDSCYFLSIYSNPELESIEGIADLIMIDDFFHIKISGNPML